MLVYVNSSIIVSHWISFSLRYTNSLYFIMSMAYYDLITVILKPLLLSSMKPCDSVINIAVVYARMNLIMNVLTLKPLVSQKSELFPSILPNYIRFMIKMLIPSKIPFILPFIKACPFYDKNIKDRLSKYLLFITKTSISFHITMPFVHHQIFL